MHIPVYESHVKEALYAFLGKEVRVAEVNDAEQSVDSLPQRYPWILRQPLVAKPDVLVGKRGKNGLVAVNKTWDEVRAWMQQRLGKPMEIGGRSMVCHRVMVEPYVPHAPEEEYYVSIQAAADEDTILLSRNGGVDIEEQWDSVVSFPVPVGEKFERDAFEKFVRAEFSETGFCSEPFFDFAEQLYTFFREWGFVFLEINPLVIHQGAVAVLDVKGRLDSAEEWRRGALWKEYFQNDGAPQEEQDKQWPAYVREAEQRVAELDALSGSSLKLTVLNPHGSIWPLVAGGGASVLIADAVVARGLGNELGLYGEYSGNPARPLVREYADIVIRLLLAAQTNRRKTLLIAGGIANFTDVAKTFAGIIDALHEHAEDLRKQNVQVLVRRGGPHYREGLKRMKEALERIGVPHEVHSPAVGLTDIVVKIPV